jgi:hypothetical protein
MTPASECVRNLVHIDPVTRAAQWLADQSAGGVTLFFSIPEIASSFGLTDADAAEAILLAGNYSVCRRAFA